MKKLLSILIAIIVCSPAIAQQTVPQWGFTAGPPLELWYRGSGMSSFAKLSTYQGFSAHVATNTALAAAATASYPSGVWRDDYATGAGAAPIWFKPQTGTCAANSLVNDGGSCVNTTAGDGNSWRGPDPTDFLDVRQYGVLASNAAATNVSRLQNLISSANAFTVKNIYFPEGAYDLTGYGLSIFSVRFVGPGTITGVYRKSVDPAGVANTFNPSPTLDPSRHMRKFLARRNPTVVIVGDSLSLQNEYNNSSSPRNGIFEQVRKDMIAAYPEKNINFVSRGIGGARYFDLNGVWGGAMPSWYTNPALPWLDYIEDQLPDLVILAFGMNDGNLWNAGNFQYDDFWQAIKKIRNWEKDPDIIFTTNMVPSLSNATFGTKAQQEGRDAIAGMTRTVALGNDYGLLDVHRSFVAFRDGFDIWESGLNSYLVTQTTTIPFEPTAYEVYDYKLKASFTNIPANFWDPGGVGTNPVKIWLSPKDENAAFISDDGGFLKITVYADTAYEQAIVKSTIATPGAGSNVEFDIEVYQNHLKVLINGSELFNQRIIRYGGLFVPYFTYALNPAGMSGTFTLMYGSPQRFPTSLVDADIYATTTQPGCISFNHPCAASQLFFMSTTLDALPWRASHIQTSEEALLDWLRADTGFAIDFANDIYVIRDATDPSNNVSGPVSSIVAGAITYATHPVTGERVGILESGVNVNHILLTDIPWSTTEGTMLVEAYDDVNGNTIHAVIGPNAANDPRIQIHSSTGNTLAIFINDNALATIFQGATTKNPYLTFSSAAIAWKDDDMSFSVDGHLEIHDFAGTIPTGLGRIKLGNANGTAPNDVVIRRLLVIPSKITDAELMSRTGR